MENCLYVIQGIGNLIIFAIKKSFHAFVRIVVAIIATIVLSDCICIQMHRDWDAYISKLSEKRAQEIGYYLYENRNKKEIEEEIQKQLDDILSKEILWKEQKIVRGYNVPQLGFSKETEKCMLVQATAYWTMDPVEASGTGIAYDGTPAVPYRTIAVDPKVIPLGAEVYVPEIGWCRANDTGNAIKGKIIDVAMPSRADAWNWGRRLCYIKIRYPKKGGN